MDSDFRDVDYVIVGAGLVGSVIAHELAERKHKKIMVWERRDHIAGNMYDYTDAYGIRVHKYGPHVFHTNNPNLYDYLRQFSDFEPFYIDCLAEIDGVQTPSPFNFKTIDDFYSEEGAIALKNAIKSNFKDRDTATVLEVMNHADSKIREFGKFLFEKDYAPYTAKQWGVSPKTIHPSVLSRVPIRFSYKTGYFDDDIQVLPTNGYTDIFNALLSHDNIKVELGVDALSRISLSKNEDEVIVKCSKKPINVIFTGAVDELFNWKFGALPYRSLRFEWIHERTSSFQNAPLVAYPQKKGFTRITEYNKLPIQAGKGSSYAVEYPVKYEKSSMSEPYYPILTNESLTLHQRYLTEAQKVKNLILAGRLADFRYYNMDQALQRALEVVEAIC